MRLIKFLNEEGGFKLNCSVLPLDKAREYAEEQFNKSNKNLDETLPDFDKNYLFLQNKLKKALDIPRIKMPVIEPTDMKEFDKKLKSGHLDIFPPFAGKKPVFTKDAWKPMSKKKGEEWVGLGLKDGDPKDDIVQALWTYRAGKSLIPLQSEIWLEKLITNIIKFGPPKSGSPVLETTIIVSSDGYILDGHHRFGQVLLSDPNLKMHTLFIPLDIQTLLKVGRSYSAAIGNKPKG